MSKREKCILCWHFIEENDADPRLMIPAGYGGVAPYIHLDDGEKEHDHDAAPSGDARTLAAWKTAHPELFRRFRDGKTGPNSPLFTPE